MNERINTLLKNHFKQHRIVIWYDPNEEMREIFDSFSDENITKIVLDNDEFAIKYRILKQEPEHQFLIYAKKPRPNPENNWLLDIESANLVFSAEPAAIIAHELNINSRFKHLIQERLGFFKNRSERLEPLAKIVSFDSEESDLQYAMLSIAASRTKKEREIILPLSTIIVSLCAETNAEERWKKVVEWKLDSQFFKCVEREYAIRLSVPEPRGILLQLFYRAFLYQTGKDRIKENRIAFIFIETWRQSKQETELYRNTAQTVENELNMVKILDTLTNEQLIGVDIFPSVDKILLLRFSTELSNSNIDLSHVSELIRQRMTTYWYLYDCEEQLKSWYNAIGTACSLLLEISNFKRNTALRASSAKELWEAYTTQFYRIDQLYRIFMMQYKNAGQPSSLAKSLKKFSAVYLYDYLKPLTERWQTLLDSNGSLDFAESQNTFFSRYIERLLLEGKQIFVIISDGLRWEAGSELANLLLASGKYKVSVTPIRAVIPTITSHGMAALLPHKTIERDPEKNEVRIDGQVVSGIEGRSKYISKTISTIKEGMKGTALSLNDFLTLSSENLAEQLSGQQLVYLYSSKIDTEGHSFDEGLPKAVHEELHQLLDTVKRISRLSNARIFITADHGFLFSGDARDNEFMLDILPIPGETWRDQRYILGHNLEPRTGLMLIHPGEPGLSSDTTALIAKGLMKIVRKGASGNFIHGGITIQELCIPLIQLTIEKKEITHRAQVAVLTTSEITTPSFTITLYQEEPVGGLILPHRLRLWFEGDDGTIISNKTECYCDSTDTEKVNRSFKVSFEFLPTAHKFKGKTVMLRLHTIAAGETLILYNTVEFKLKQIAYDIDIF